MIFIYSRHKSTGYTDTAHISQFCQLSFSLVYDILIKPKFFFLSYSNPLSLMVHSSLLDLLKKSLHILKTYILYFPLFKKVLHVECLIQLEFISAYGLKYRSNSPPPYRKPIQQQFPLSLLIETAISSTTNFSNTYGSISELSFLLY